MTMAFPCRNLKQAWQTVLLCRGCLGPLEGSSEAGLCGTCWSGLAPLPDPRCPICALPHPPETNCRAAEGWVWGDALWDYHGGRPPLGAMLVPGIKHGERGWKKALLRRLTWTELPSFAPESDLITSAPTSCFRRWRRGFDLAEDTARALATRLSLPFRRTLRKAWFSPQQTERAEHERRKLPRKAIACIQPRAVAGQRILLVDDVWTTGTTLLRCAQALKAAGAQEIRVLALFRSLPVASPASPWRVPPSEHETPDKQELPQEDLPHKRL